MTQSGDAGDSPGYNHRDDKQGQQSEEDASEEFDVQHDVGDYQAEQQAGQGSYGQSDHLKRGRRSSSQFNLAHLTILHTCAAEAEGRVLCHWFVGD